MVRSGENDRLRIYCSPLAANARMLGGSGIDGAIHRAAGDELYQACRRHHADSHGDRLPTGQSRILLSYNLHPRISYIINTAGPVYSSNSVDECARKLRSCYTTALALANLYDLQSIAFPAISCGIYGYVSTICLKRTHPLTVRSPASGRCCPSGT